MRKILPVTLAMQGRMKVLVTVLGLAVFLSIASGVVLANHGGIPADNSAATIQGCYENQNPSENKGSLRVVPDNTVDCKQNETPITWLAAVPGPAGPQGPAGGINGWQKVSSSIAPNTTGFAKTTVAVCPSGKKALGGGVRALGGGSRKIIGSFPTGSGNGWIGEVAKSVASESLGLDVYVICADVN